MQYAENVKAIARKNAARKNADWKISLLLREVDAGLEAQPMWTVTTPIDDALADFFEGLRPLEDVRRCLRTR